MSHPDRHGAILATALALLTGTLLSMAADPTDAQPESIGGKTPPKAARSVHLGWPAPNAEVFYMEMAVDQSVTGSYFMACGWNTGYFGIQELTGGRKIAIFSVWDPTRGDAPDAVKIEDRVELLYEGTGTRIKRFGGEGTGGQCTMDFDWKLGSINRFMVRARVDGQKTAYSGYLCAPGGEWKHLVTFRTRTGGSLWKGLYSFVEDFRRDGRSVMDQRRASFGNGWIRSTSGSWTRLAQPRFTASGAAWEAKDNIDAGCAGDRFYLMTGGQAQMSRPLRSTVDCGGGIEVIPDPLKTELEAAAGCKQ